MRCACLGEMPSSLSSGSQHPCRVLVFALRNARANTDFSPSSSALWMASMTSCGGRDECSRRRPISNRLASSNVSGTASPAISVLNSRFCFAVAFIMPRLVGVVFGRICPIPWSVRKYDTMRHAENGQFASVDASTGAGPSPSASHCARSSVRALDKSHEHQGSFQPLPRPPRCVP